MCQRGGLLIAYVLEQSKAFVTDADCDSWKCPECKEKLRDKWSLRAEMGVRALIGQGCKVDFVTLTSHERNQTFASGAAVFPHAWGQLSKRLKRQSEVREYFMVAERHKSGALHMHCLWTFGVSKRWLKDNARECGLGYMADVQEVQTVLAATKYVTKYLTKSLGDEVPPRFRRVRVSSGWADVPEAHSDQSAYEWQHIAGNGALNEAYKECERQGLTMVDVRTGEIFDDVDLGTIAWTS